MTGRAVGGIAVPAYFHPATAPSSWERLIGSQLGNGFAIINLADGPGSAPDNVVQDAARRLATAGTSVLGYVDSGYGRRGIEVLIREFADYRRWYGVQGVFVDQALGEPALLPHYRELVERLRSARADRVVLNYGVPPDESFAEVGDVLVTFEGPMSAYLQASQPRWTRRIGAHRQCHLVYGAPESATPALLLKASRRGAGLVYVTACAGRNPWRDLAAWVPERDDRS